MKRRFIQDPVSLELIEVSEDYCPLPPNGDSVLWNDRTYQDMNDPRFTSRSQHREYMARNGLTTTDDFLGGEWRSREAQRIAAKQGVDPSRKQDIADALHRLRSR